MVNGVASMIDYKISDELIDRLKKITPERLSDFFKSDDIEPVCSICKSKVLLVSFESDTETGDQYIVPSVIGYLRANKKIGMAFTDLDCLSYKLTCSKCSHETYFGVAKVLEWSEEMRNNNE